jgi:rod shape-determining protein MreD
VRNWGLWIVVLVLVLLHLLLHLGLGWGGWVPDLLAVALLLGSRDLRIGAGAGFGFLLGLLEDAFSLLAFGANAVTFTLLGIVGARTRDLFVGDSALFMVSYLALGVWLRTLIHWILAGPVARGDLVEVVIVEGIPGALYAAAVGFVALLASGSWQRELPPR